MRIMNYNIKMELIKLGHHCFLVKYSFYIFQLNLGTILDYKQIIIFWYDNSKKTITVQSNVFKFWYNYESYGT